MKSGSIKWFNITKGFGFIVPQDGGADIFVHVSALEKSGIRPNLFQEGQKVSYELATNREGKASAVNLKLL